MFHCTSETLRFAVDRDLLPSTCVFLEKPHVSLSDPGRLLCCSVTSYPPEGRREGDPKSRWAVGQEAGDQGLYAGTPP